MTRFSPPEVVPEPELLWVLLRAFSRVPSDPPPKPGRAVEMARRLGIASLLAARAARGALRAELGEEAAEALQGDLVAAVAQEMRLLDLARHVAVLAAGLQLPVVLLKFAALRLSGAVSAGERDAGDVDVLVAEDGREPLAAALEADGFRRSTIPDWEHQLPALYHPRRGMVEIHGHLPGLRPPGRSTGPFVRFHDLQARGALRPAPDLPGAAFVPSEAVCAAHALAHGVVQHGLAPASYPLLRTLTDLAALRVSADDVAAWLSGTLAPVEVRETLELVASLREAPLDPRRLDRSRAGDAFLLHVLAGTFDERYRESLTLRRVLDPLSERSRIASLGAAVARAVFPSEAELHVLYPDLIRRRGIHAARLVRPLDLVKRAGRSLWHVLVRRRKGS